MSSSGYTAWSVTAGEQPTTAYWNILGTNDQSFNTGTGFNDGILLSRHIGSTMISGLANAYTNSSNAGGSGFWYNIGGLKILLIQGVTTSSTAWNFINWSIVGFTNPPYCFGSTQETTTPSGWVEFASYTSGGAGTISTTGCSLLTRTSNSTNASDTTVMILAMGQ